MDKKALPEKRRQGVLYVVATPIGNLEDITLRALRVLKEVDLILAEHKGHTKRICDHYGIRTGITTYNQHSSRKRTLSFAEQLETGVGLALVSDAGTPGISDPGIMLISAAIERGIQITPIPGPCAAVAGLSVCGFPLNAFCFLGFLSNRSGRRRKELETLVSEKRTIVFYESCHRIKETLSDLVRIFGQRPMVMFREMTKLYEEIRRGSAAEILEGLTPENTRGEFTLVISGDVSEKDSETLHRRILGAIDHLLEEDTLSVRDIAALIAEREQVGYRKVYKECLARKALMKGP